MGQLQTSHKRFGCFGCCILHRCCPKIHSEAFLFPESSLSCLPGCQPSNARAGAGRRRLRSSAEKREAVLCACRSRLDWLFARQSWREWHLIVPCACSMRLQLIVNITAHGQSHPHFGATSFPTSSFPTLILIWLQTRDLLLNLSG